MSLAKKLTSTEIELYSHVIDGAQLSPDARDTLTKVLAYRGVTRADERLYYGGRLSKSVRIFRQLLYDFWSPKFIHIITSDGMKRIRRSEWVFMRDCLVHHESLRPHQEEGFRSMRERLGLSEGDFESLFRMEGSQLDDLASDVKRRLVDSLKGTGRTWDDVESAHCLFDIADNLYELATSEGSRQSLLELLNELCPGNAVATIEARYLKLCGSRLALKTNVEWFAMPQGVLKELSDLFDAQLRASIGQRKGAPHAVLGMTWATLELRTAEYQIASAREVLNWGPDTVISGPLCLAFANHCGLNAQDVRVGLFVQTTFVGAAIAARGFLRKVFASSAAEPLRKGTRIG